MDGDLRTLHADSFAPVFSGHLESNLISEEMWLGYLPRFQLFVGFVFRASEQVSFSYMNAIMLLSAAFELSFSLGKGIGHPEPGLKQAAADSQGSKGTLNLYIVLGRGLKGPRVLKGECTSCCGTV